MKRFRNILVFVNGKDRGVLAISRAAELARRNSAKLTLVDVVDTYSSRLAVPGTEPGKSQDAILDQKLSQLTRIAEPLRETGLAVIYMVLRGNPAQQIVERVYNDGYDLVIKTAEEPPGIVRRLFGMTAWRLLRCCPCPVWIIKAAKETKFQKILAAVDPSPTDEERDLQNLKIMQLASSIAENDGSELHVVHVLPDGIDLVSPDHAQLSAVEHDTRNGGKASLQESLLSKLLAPFQEAGRINHVHLRTGKPGDEIAELVDELHIQLLVMGTVSRSSMKEFLIGTTAERVLDQVDCSVLTVKPDDFVNAPRP